MNRILSGQVFYEVAGGYHHFWGSTPLKKAAFDAAGANWRGGSTLDLPLATPFEVIEALKAPIFAAPISTEWVKIDNSQKYHHDVEYTATYKDGSLRIVLHDQSMYIEADSFPLARSLCKFSCYAKRINEDVQEARLKPMIGDWEVKPSDYNSFSDPQRREFDRVIGGLLAGLMLDYPEALAEGRNHSRAEDRQRAKDKIAKLVKELTDAQNELNAVPADEPVPLSKAEYAEVYEMGRKAALDGVPSPITVEQITAKTSPMLAAHVTGWSAGKAELLAQVQTVIG